MIAFQKIWRVFFFLKHPIWDSPFCLITDDWFLQLLGMVWRQQPIILVNWPFMRIENRNHFSLFCWKSFTVIQIKQTKTDTFRRWALSSKETAKILIWSTRPDLTPAFLARSNGRFIDVIRHSFMRKKIT